MTDLLRTRLGLPLFGPIAIPDGSSDAAMELLDGQPVWRWVRFDVEKLPLEVLLDGLQILSVMREPTALNKFARELLNRPIEDTPYQARQLAFGSIVDTFLLAGRLEETLEWIERAKSEAMVEECSDVTWNFHEVSVFLGLNRSEEAHTVLEHIIGEHGRESGVMQALNNFFVQLGLLNPDGTPTARSQRLQGSSHSAPAGGLWTPDAEVGVPPGNSSKLWTPDDLDPS